MTEIGCRHCDGTGMTVLSHRCPDCDGHPAQFGDCQRCGAEGWLPIEQQCDACQGEGSIEVEY